MVIKQLQPWVIFHVSSAKLTAELTIPNMEDLKQIQLNVFGMTASAVLSRCLNLHFTWKLNCSVWVSDVSLVFRFLPFPFLRSPQELVSGKTHCFWEITRVWEKEGGGLEVSYWEESLRRHLILEAWRVTHWLLSHFVCIALNTLERGLVLNHASHSLQKKVWNTSPNFHSFSSSKLVTQWYLKIGV